ncbi:MAG: extracellular solute-binding protein [Proteobacteria bacterium]|nr:extracellular solute-binding protein [Pseudomonadota bacterium]
MRKWHLFSVLAGAVLLFALSDKSSGDDKLITLSTTTSTQASGLLDILLPAFEKDTGIKVKVIAKGTGAAIRDGKDGNVDIIFVHAKDRELAFVREGYGTRRYGIMHNDFVILGPKNDPAGINGQKNAVAALKQIAAHRAGFVSRGDDSGTHTKEQALWKKTGLPLDRSKTTIIKNGKQKVLGSVKPEGDWYVSLGQGMGKSLTFADEKKIYILADRGTYLKYKYGKKPPIDLVVLCDGDPSLNNPYGIIPINPKKHPHVKYDLAAQFASWLVSPVAQSLIENYRLHGRQLFYPNASRESSRRQ